jgi:hypothetical protein
MTAAEDLIGNLKEAVDRRQWERERESDPTTPPFDEWKGIRDERNAEDAKRRADKKAKSGQEQKSNANGSQPPPAAATDLILPAEFYESRAVLKHMRDYAHSRGTSADPVLYAGLTRISGMVPHQCRLETGIGSPRGASLNLFAAPIGPTGTSKSSSASVARNLYPVPKFPDFADGLPLGSGEGIAEAFMGWEEQDTGEVYKTGDKKGEPKTKSVRCQTRHNAFLVADEGEAFSKMTERSGATLGPTVRTAWYGGTLGNQNADPNRNRNIPEGSYSLGMLIGFQPETVLSLLRDDATGTPARFVYCHTIDPTIPAEPVSYWRPDIPPTPFAPAPSRMHLQQSIAREVWQHHHARQSGAVEVSRLDAHRNLTKLKLAALLALLEGRTDVNEDDWRLAGVMWDVSCKVRDHYLAYGATADAADRLARNMHHADREGLAEVRRQQVRNASTMVERVARLIARYVHDPVKPSRTVGDVNRRLESPLRQHLTEALDYAVLEGWIEVNGTNVSRGPSRPA